MSSIPHYLNLSLEPIQEIYEGVLYTEEWRPIVGYEGYYEVSSFGRVKSLERIDSSGAPRQLRIMKSFPSYEYRRVCLQKDGVEKKFQVHRLVGVAFVANPKNLPQVNHKMGIRWDNRYFMLEWNTGSDNIKHAFRELGKKPNCFWTGKFGDKHPNGHYVVEVSSDGFLQNVYGSKNEAARNIGVTNKYVAHCVKRGKKIGNIYLK